MASEFDPSEFVDDPPRGLPHAGPYALEPKCVEHMVKATTVRWTLRFWFNGSRVGPAAHQARVKAFVDSKLEPPDSFDDAGALVLKVRCFFCQDALAAFEVTDARGNGFVEYYEWP